MQTTSWVEGFIWLIAAGAAAVFEVFHPAFFLIFISFGAVLASIAAFLGFNELVQGIVFIVSSTSFLFFVRPFVKHVLEKNKRPLTSNVYNIIGVKAIVIQPVDQLKGKVKIMNTGEVWSAYTYEHFEPINENAKVVVKEVDGAKLVVIPKQAADAEKKSEE